MAASPGNRKYKRPLTSIQKMRTMRMINYVREAIRESAVEEGELEIERSAEGQLRFVEKHRRLQPELAGHFPFLDMRGDQYASDIAARLAQEITYYILHGDTPGP